MGEELRCALSCYSHAQFRRIRFFGVRFFVMKTPILFRASGQFLVGPPAGCWASGGYRRRLRRALRIATPHRSPASKHPLD